MNLRSINLNILKFRTLSHPSSGIRHNTHTHTQTHIYRRKSEREVIVLPFGRCYPDSSKFSGGMISTTILPSSLSLLLLQLCTLILRILQRALCYPRVCAVQRIYLPAGSSTDPYSFVSVQHTVPTDCMCSTLLKVSRKTRKSLTRAALSLSVALISIIRAYNYIHSSNASARADIVMRARTHVPFLLSRESVGVQSRSRRRSRRLHEGREAAVTSRGALLRLLARPRIFYPCFASLTLALSLGYRTLLYYSPRSRGGERLFKLVIHKDIFTFHKGCARAHASAPK